MIPLRVWSLLEIMRQFQAWQLAKIIHELTQVEWLCSKQCDMGERDTPVRDHYLDAFVKPLVESCRTLCVSTELNSALARIDGPMRVALNFIPSPSWNDLHVESRVLREQIEADLARRRFMFIPAEKAQLLDKIGRDWDSVWRQFPSAKEDSEEAVHCCVLGRNTATVFHLMRVAEYGLRALARERHIKLAKNRPLDWAEWNEIISGIGKSVDHFANRRRGPARDAALEFYRGALGQFQAFKDVYRNHVMHSRKSYDEHQAMSVLLHVREFMGRLAGKMDEHPKKAIKWGRF